MNLICSTGTLQVEIGTHICQRILKLTLRLSQFSQVSKLMISIIIFDMTNT